MRYSQFLISNFKGINEIRIDLDRTPHSPVFALVGLNESGKTTILEAIHWLYDDSRINPEDLIPRGMLASFGGEVSVSARLKLNNEDTDKVKEFLWKKCNKFELATEIDEIDIKRTYAFVDSQLASRQLKWSIHLEGKTKRAQNINVFREGDKYWNQVRSYVESDLYPPIIYYENFLFDFPEKLYLRAKEGVSLTKLEERYKAVVQDVLSSFKRPLNVDRHLVDRYINNIKRPLEATLNSLSSNVSTAVFKIWEELLKFEETSGMEISFGHDLKDDEKGYYLEVSVKEEDQSYLIRERSLGFRWFFAFFVFTIFRAFRYEKQIKALFLLDEPASNLHPTAQAKLLNVFEEIPNKQTIIYATHSHHMINPKWLSGTFVVKNEALRYEDIDIGYSSYQTNIDAIPYPRFASDNPDDTDYFKPILDSLDYQPSNLELVPEVLIVEGKNDYYTLRFIKELGYVSATVGDNISPGSGKDTLECLISLYLGWGKSFVILLDDDKGGRETYQLLKGKFGGALDGSIFRLNHADKRFKSQTLEGVFAKRDQVKIIKTVFPEESEFDKEKFNIAVQDNYFNSNKVELSEYSQDRLSSLFEFLDKAFQKDNGGSVS